MFVSTGTLNNGSISSRYPQIPFYCDGVTIPYSPAYFPASVRFLCAFVSSSQPLPLFEKGWHSLLGSAMPSHRESWESLGVLAPSLLKTRGSEDRAPSHALRGLPDLLLASLVSNPHRASPQSKHSSALLQPLALAPLGSCTRSKPFLFLLLS